MNAPSSRAFHSLTRPVPSHVVAALSLNVDVSSVLIEPLRFSVLLTVTPPLLLMMPLLHTIAGVLIAPLPPRLAPDSVRFGVVVAMFRFNVPLDAVMKLGFSVPLAGVRLNVAPLTVIDDGFMLVVGVKVPVPPVPLSVPVAL